MIRSLTGLFRRQQAKQNVLEQEIEKEPQIELTHQTTVRVHTVVMVQVIK